VDSDIEAERLIEDLTEHPGEPLRTPHWGNAVYATVRRRSTPEPAPTRPVALT
jgi:hypothetical protein